MATKITLTIQQDEDAPNDTKIAMTETLALLAAAGITAPRRLVLTIECKDDEAENITDELDAALSGRPMGIEVVIKTTTERHVERKRMANVTPMDQAWRN